MSFPEKVVLAAVVAVALSCVVFFCPALVGGRTPDPAVNPEPPPSAKFRTGDMVRSKLDGRIGQVVYVWDRSLPATYNVRFATGSSATNVHASGSRFRPENMLYIIVHDMLEDEIDPAGRETARERP